MLGLPFVSIQEDTCPFFVPSLFMKDSKRRITKLLQQQSVRGRLAAKAKDVSLRWARVFDEPANLTGETQQDVHFRDGRLRAAYKMTQGVHERIRALTVEKVN